MNLDRPVVDFETDKIQSRPYYPPRPVGMAVRNVLSGKSRYYAWGHPEGNNCDVGTAREVLRDIYRSGVRPLFHNGQFDMDVAEVHFGLATPSQGFDDSLFLAFLNNPHEPTLSLKPMSEKYLDMPPDEATKLHDWIIANVPEAKRAPKQAGAYISRAPGGLVGEYAIGDVDRTDGLFRKFMPEIVEKGMREAYEREIALTPITMEMERSGIAIDLDKTKDFLGVFEDFDKQLQKRILKKLKIDMPVGKAKGQFNLNSGKQLADALLRAGKLDAIIKTPSGQISTKVDNLKKTCNDKDLLSLLSIHSVAEKYITSFLRPWVEQAELSGGRILPRFNQVRNRGDDGGGGARTGRYSSSDPNLQNISANVAESKNAEVLLLMQKMIEEMYQFRFIGLRDLIVPDDGQVIIAVDYNQQELRLLAHFEQGLLMEEYLKDPKLDVHTFIQQMIKKITGIEYPRKFIKIAVFGIVYGMGVGKLALMLGEDERTARKVRDGLLEAVPGIRKLIKQLRRLADRDEPLRTWGGRLYYCEEPYYNREDDEWYSFEYKMLNYLIQPSAADVTKQGMLNVAGELDKVRIAIQVHDELVCMAPSAKYGPKIARAMCDMKFNVPMMAEPKHSSISWARVA